MKDQFSRSKFGQGSAEIRYEHGRRPLPLSMAEFFLALSIGWSLSHVDSAVSFAADKRPWPNRISESKAIQ